MFEEYLIVFSLESYFAIIVFYSHFFCFLGNPWKIWTRNMFKEYMVIFFLGG